MTETSFTQEQLLLLFALEEGAEAQVDLDPHVIMNPIFSISQLCCSLWQQLPTPPCLPGTHFPQVREERDPLSSLILGLSDWPQGANHCVSIGHNNWPGLGWGGDKNMLDTLFPKSIILPI